MIITTTMIRWVAGNSVQWRRGFIITIITITRMRGNTMISQLLSSHSSRKTTKAIPTILLLPAQLILHHEPVHRGQRQRHELPQRMPLQHLRAPGQEHQGDENPVGFLREGRGLREGHDGKLSAVVERGGSAAQYWTNNQLKINSAKFIGNNQISSNHRLKIMQFD